MSIPGTVAIGLRSLPPCVIIRTKVTDSQQIEVSYGYDSAGNKLFMLDGRGKLTQYNYGSFGLLRSVVDASNQTTSYKYDLALNKTRETDRMQRAITYAYDNRTLLTAKKAADTGDQVLYSI
ncbi:hypothetical protein [Paenibacillus sp. FSL R7-0331]|uniref:hypothetical protein n=1 Tax=Paenibacillus sp. FSL R7-0331 TaxID=1536773 RepID=UPI0009DD72BC|nr:hypothetical protein [Paenibacillus sp. FSL R7-0331]